MIKEKLELSTASVFSCKRDLNVSHHNQCDLQFKTYHLFKENKDTGFKYKSVESHWQSELVRVSKNKTGTVVQTIPACMCLLLYHSYQY